VSGELVPQPSQQRISDADRQRVTERLQAAVGVGRLTLAEFEQRLSAVLAARTLGEVEPFVADLPGGAVSAPAPEYVALRTRAASLKRRGQWVVARRTLVVAKSGSVKLDFTDALIAHPEVTIELDVQSGSTTLVLPPGASVDIDNVEFVASRAHVHGVLASPVAGSGLHVIVRGKQRAGRLVVRYARRFWRWRW